MTYLGRLRYTSIDDPNDVRVQVLRNQFCNETCYSRTHLRRFENDGVPSSNCRSLITVVGFSFIGEQEE